MQTLLSTSAHHNGLLGNAFSAVLSTEGRVVGPCWGHLKPKGPKADVNIFTSAHTGFEDIYHLTSAQHSPQNGVS